MERVLKKAQEWNYIPNESARHFKMNKSFTIGLIIPDLMDQFYILAINGVEEIAATENYNIILTQSHEDIKKEKKIINVMIKNRIDGIITAITKDTVNMSLFQKFKEIGIPVVCIAREPQNNSFNYVCINNEEAAFTATDFLIQRGHQRIAHLMGPKTMQVSKERLKGYRQALMKHKIPIDPDLVKVVDFSRSDTSAAINQLMKLKSPPTGIFTFKNYITLDAIDYLKKTHPRKLNKIDFVSFGNLPLLKYLNHKPLASIDECSYEMGEAAARLLFEMISEKTDTEKAKKIEIPCRLIIHK